MHLPNVYRTIATAQLNLVFLSLFGSLAIHESVRDTVKPSDLSIPPPIKSLTTLLSPILPREAIFN